MTDTKNLMIKLFVVLSFVLFLVLENESLGCGGCSKSKFNNMAANVQSAVGTTTSTTNGLSGARIIGAAPAGPAFKDSKIFSEVGQEGDQDPDKPWNSAISN